jgi:hypothetical protein
MWDAILLQVSVGKTRSINGAPNRRPGVDVIMFDCPENLPVPGVSRVQNEVPVWNEDTEYEAMHSVFAFAERHLQDHGCLVITHSFSVASKSAILGLLEIYPRLKKKKEWLGMNRLWLTSASDTTTTVSVMQYRKSDDVISLWIFYGNSYMQMLVMLPDTEVLGDPFREGPWRQREIELLF